MHLPITDGEFQETHTIKMPTAIDCGGVDLIMVGQNHREYKVKFSFLGGDQLCTYNAETQEYDVGCVFVGLGASKYPNLPLFRGKLKVPTEFTVTCTPIGHMTGNNKSDSSMLLALKFLPPLANQMEKHQRVHTVSFNWVNGAKIKCKHISITCQCLWATAVRPSNKGI